MITLNPSFPQNKNNYRFKPDMLVYVPVLETKDLDYKPLLCNIAYLSKASAKTHFWFTSKQKGDKVTIECMSVMQFLSTHDWQGMNPFETINKFEFRKKYQILYPESKGCF